MAAAPQEEGPAYPAACLLFVVEPDCPISCRDAIRAMLPGWDVSIEELPWYLAGQFGEDTVYQAIQELNKETLNQEQRTRLETVQYWVEIYFGFTPQKVQELQRRLGER